MRPSDIERADDAPPPPLAAVRRAYGEAFRKDARDVAAGLYPPPGDPPFNPVRAVAGVADVIMDGRAVEQRRRRRGGTDGADPAHRPGGVDPVLGIPRLKDAFLARFPDYSRGITVPAIVDVTTGQVVTNDFPQMTLDLSTEWTAHHREGAPDLYPEALRAEIDEVNALVFKDVNNGVYRCGF